MYYCIAFELLALLLLKYRRNCKFNNANVSSFIFMYFLVSKQFLYSIQLSISFISSHIHSFNLWLCVLKWNDSFICNCKISSTWLLACLGVWSVECSVVIVVIGSRMGVCEIASATLCFCQTKHDKVCNILLLARLSV